MKRLSEKKQPSREFLQLVEEGISQIQLNDPALDAWFKNYSANHKYRIAFDLEYVSHELPHSENINILELGSLPFLFTYAAQKMGYIITGLDKDPSRFSTTIQKEQLKVISVDLNNGTLPFENNSFDGILMNEVLEHLHCNLVQLFMEIHRVLKPGGKLFVSTPNLRSFFGLYQFLLKNTAYSCANDLYTEHHKELTLGHMGHVREYTTHEIIQLLERMDFTVNRLIYRGAFGKRLWWVNWFPKLKPYFSVIAQKKSSL